jgi:hypothetical protein
MAWNVYFFTVHAAIYAEESLRQALASKNNM